MKNSIITAVVLLMWTSSALSQTANFDPNKFYRITNSYMGATQSLDVNPDGVAMMMAPTGNATGQLWKIILQPDGSFKLSCKWQGDSKVLDVINDGNNNQINLTAIGNYSGQSWRIERTTNGFYRLTNGWQTNKSLDCDKNKLGNFVGLMPSGNKSGQFWKITEVSTSTPLKATPKPIAKSTAISFTNGRWISKDDPNAGIEISGNQWTSFYKEGANESRTDYNYEVSKKTISGQTFNNLKITNGNESLEYSIMNYSKNELKLIHLVRGNTLTYTPEIAASVPGLAVFTNWPAAIEGCSCSFGKTLNDTYKKKYTYVDNFEETAVISLNGQMMTFKLTKSAPSSENSIAKTFANGEYTLKFEVKKTGNSDSQSLFKGTVTVMKNGKVIAKDSVEGSCGC